MINPKVSIIVPVYNSADYLRRCIDSLINQSLKEVEIIVFDDSSIDNSIEIIEEYLENGNQLVFIKNETNIMTGAIRNMGVQMAKGKYIMFVDSDDWIDRMACETLFDIAEQNSLDILVGKIRNTNGEESKSDIVNLDKNPILLSGCNFMLNNEFSSVVWDKLWLRDFIVRHNLKCTENRYYEDLQMTIEGLLAANCVASIDYLFYSNFVGNLTSVSRSIQTEKHLNDKQWNIEFMLNKIDYYSGSIIVTPLKKKLAIGIYAALSKIRRYYGNDEESKNNLLIKIQEALSKTGYTILKVKSIPLLKRIFIFISPIIYLKVCQIYDRFKN